MLLFYFGNVVSRGKDGREKALVLLTHIDGYVLQFFFEKFTISSAINDAGKNHIFVKSAFLERFVRRPEPQDIIRRATDTTLDEKNHELSLERMDSLCAHASFNEEAKLGFLRVAVTNIFHVATFAMYRRLSDYTQFARAGRDF